MIPKFRSNKCYFHGPMSTEDRWRMRLWGSQVELAKEFQKGMDLSYSSVSESREFLDQDMLSLASPNPANIVGRRAACG